VRREHEQLAWSRALNRAKRQLAAHPEQSAYRKFHLVLISFARERAIFSFSVRISG